MRQLNLNEIRRDPQLEQLLKPVKTQPKTRKLSEKVKELTSRGGTGTTFRPYGNISMRFLNFYSRLGECLDSRIKKLAEGSQ